MMTWLKEVLGSGVVMNAAIYLVGAAIYFVGKWLYAKAPAQVVEKFWSYLETPIDTLIDKLEEAQKSGKLDDNVVESLVAQALVAARDRYRKFEGVEAPAAFNAAAQLELEDVVARIKGE